MITSRYKRYYLRHKREEMERNREKYEDKRVMCPHAKMLGQSGMFCPWLHFCIREDKGKYDECIKR